MKRTHEGRAAILRALLPLVVTFFVLSITARSAGPTALALVSGLAGQGEALLLRGETSRPLETGERLAEGDRISIRNGTVTLSLMNLATGALVSTTLDPGAEQKASELISGKKQSFLSNLYRGVARLFDGDDEAVTRVGGAQAGLMHDPTQEQARTETKSLKEAPSFSRPSARPAPAPMPSKPKRREYAAPTIAADMPSRSIETDDLSPRDGCSDSESDMVSALKPSKSLLPSLQAKDDESLSSISEFGEGTKGLSALPASLGGGGLARANATADASVRSYNGLSLVRRGSGWILPLGRLRFLLRKPTAKNIPVFVTLQRIREKERKNLPRELMDEATRMPHLEVDLRHHGFLVGDLLRWTISTYQGEVLEGPHVASIVSPFDWVQVLRLDKASMKVTGPEQLVLRLLAAQAWERLGDKRRAAARYRKLAEAEGCSPRDRRVHLRHAESCEAAAKAEEAR